MLLVVDQEKLERIGIAVVLMERIMLLLLLLNLNGHLKIVVSLIISFLLALAVKVMALDSLRK